jgi:uncharacterized membrane protein
MQHEKTPPICYTQESKSSLRTDRDNTAAQSGPNIIPKRRSVSASFDAAQEDLTRLYTRREDRKPMIHFENTLEINRPVEEVFAFLADFQNVPRWNYYVTDVRQLSDGPVEVGSTFHQVRKTDQQDYEITEYEPGRRVVVKTLPGETPRFERRFELEGENGSTRVVDTWALDLGRGPLVEMLGTGKVKSAVAENLGKLKELLETGQTRLQDGRVTLK